MSVQRGALCMVVAPYAREGRGAFVVAVRPVGRVLAINGTYAGMADGGGQEWLVDGWVRMEVGSLVGPRLIISSDCLRVIDPGSGQDETLQRVGLPAHEDIAWG